MTLRLDQGPSQFEAMRAGRADTLLAVLRKEIRISRTAGSVLEEDLLRSTGLDHVRGIDGRQKAVEIHATLRQQRCYLLGQTQSMY